MGKGVHFWMFTIVLSMLLSLSFTMFIFLILVVSAFALFFSLEGFWLAGYVKHILGLLPLLFVLGHHLGYCTRLLRLQLTPSVTSLPFGMCVCVC